MRLTFRDTPSARFVVDGVTLASGESTIVSNERGETLLREYPDVLTGRKDVPLAPDSKDSHEPSKKAAQPVKGTAPSDPKGN